MSRPVAVIGGSIAGLYAAERLASRGHSVRVYEGSEKLAPVRRSLIVTAALRDLLGDWAEEAVVNEIDRFELFANDRRVEVKLGRPDLIIERATLIRRLATAAGASGAEIVWGHRLERLTATDDGIDMRFRNNGTTLPRESRTLPYRTTENRVPLLPDRLLDEITILSEANLLAPYKFIGLAALSVERAITRLTLFCSAAFTTFSAPMTLV